VKLTQGLWAVGEFDGIDERTVSPKPDGKQFAPFLVEHLRLIVNDEPRVIEYREGKRPPTEDFAEGDIIVVPVRVRGYYNGVAQLDGRSLPALANE
jgi:hypothetical protein